MLTREQDHDFSEVNVALTHLELVATSNEMAIIGLLRPTLREFIKSAIAKDEDWRTRREAIDKQLVDLTQAIRKEL